MLNLTLSIHFRYNLKLEIRLQGKYGEVFFCSTHLYRWSYILVGFTYPNWQMALQIQYQITILTACLRKSIDFKAERKKYLKCILSIWYSSCSWYAFFSKLCSVADLKWKAWSVSDKTQDKFILFVIAIVFFFSSPLCWFVCLISLLYWGRWRMLL